MRVVLPGIIFNQERLYGFGEPAARQPRTDGIGLVLYLPLLRARRKAASRAGRTNHTLRLMHQRAAQRHVGAGKPQEERTNKP